MRILLFLSRLKILKPRGFVSLDALRGMAAWAVVIPHFYMFSGGHSNPAEFSTTFAVEVFFILSGFVLGRQLDLCFERNDFKSLRVFYLRRWMRTLPIFVFILFLLSALNHTLFSERFFEYLTFTTSWLSTPGTTEYFFTAWSLAIEEWFYIFFPSFLILYSRIVSKKQHHAMILFALVFLTIKLVHIFNHPNYVEGIRRITLFRLDSIAYGHLLYLADQAFGKFFSRHFVKAWALGISFAALTYFCFVNKYMLFYIYTAAVSASSFVIAFRYTEPWFKRSNFIGHLAAFFAHTSYCAYLIHLVVFQVLAKTAGDSAPSITPYIFWVMAFSVFSYYLIELPFQNARPSYNAPLEFKKYSLKESVIFRVAINVLVFCFVIGGIEYGKTIKHQFKVSLGFSAQENTTLNSDSNEMTHQEKLKVTYDIDYKNHVNMSGSPYMYSSFDVFRQRPFTSETINIDKTGERYNPNNNFSDHRPKYEVWVLGASPILGATNADAWTIPARMQVHLSKLMPKKNVVVRNFGVTAYDSWQVLTLLQKKLTRLPPPKAIFAFATNNDFERLWNLPKKNCSHLEETGVNSKSILNRSWENLSRENFVFRKDIVNRIVGQFPNINNKVKHYWKKPRRKTNELMPELEIAKYKVKRDAYNSNVKKCFPIYMKNFRTNIQLMATLANSHGIKFFAATLPKVSTSKKKLKGSAVDEMLNQKNYKFSLTDAELEKLDKLPEHRYSAIRFVSKIDYFQMDLDTNVALAQTLKNVGGYPLELDHFANNISGEIQLFSSTIHFTHEGADLIAGEIIRQSKNRLITSNLAMY